MSDGQKVAGFSLTKTHPVIATVPFVSPGVCPSVTTTIDGWQWYALGATG